jgi:hypothetical protein
MNNTISDEIMSELEILCEKSRMAQQAFREAVQDHADAHHLNPQALGRFVRAKVADRLDKLAAERETIEQLSMRFS